MSDIKNIYILSGCIDSLNKNEMTTSSQKYELELAYHLSDYVNIEILSNALAKDIISSNKNLRLIGVKEDNKKFRHLSYEFKNALKHCNAEDSVLIFWGYDLFSVLELLYIKFILKYKCIAFEYDSHKPALYAVKGIKKIVLNVLFETGKKLLKLFDGFILFQEKAVQRLGIQKKPYIVCKPGVSDVRLTKTTNLSDKFTVTYCGSFTKLNGIDVLLESFKLFSGSNIEFNICGYGPLENEVKIAAKKYSFVKFLGILNDKEIETVYKKSNLLLNLRVLDDEAMDFAFPSKLFEYIVTGTPVISTLLLEDKEFAENVFVIDTLTPQNIFDTIKYAMDNYNSGLKKAEKIKEYILKTYSFENSAKQIIQFAKKLVC